VVAHDAAQRDGVDLTGGARAEAEIDVLAAVDVGFVEAAEFFPERAFEHHARTGHGGHATHGLEDLREPRRRRAVVLGFAGAVDDDAGVIDRASAEIALDVADEPGERAERAVRRQHAVEPAREEDEVVVEDARYFPVASAAARLFRDGVAEIALV